MNAIQEAAWAVLMAVRDVMTAHKTRMERYARETGIALQTRCRLCGAPQEEGEQECRWHSDQEPDALPVETALQRVYDKIQIALLIIEHSATQANIELG